MRLLLSDGELAQPIMVETVPVSYYGFRGLTVGRVYPVSVGAGRAQFAAAVRTIDLPP